MSENVPNMDGVDVADRDGAKARTADSSALASLV